MHEADVRAVRVIQHRPAASGGFSCQPGIQCLGSHVLAALRCQLSKQSPCRVMGLFFALCQYAAHLASSYPAEVL